MKLTSTFGNNQLMDSKYTCDGEDVSPELRISNIPPNAKSLALIMDDPDAPMGTFVHWVVWNIAPTKTVIKEGEEPAMRGRTNFGKLGYGGPCPPSGTHRYFFKLYALDSQINLKEGATKAELEKAMQNHIIAKTELVGLYKRR
ncbi:MAG: YbhB/YbcL family Raf kinase inhibitor-like protein [Candidatus Woesearchaeota archaeon]